MKKLTAVTLLALVAIAGSAQAQELAYGYNGRGELVSFNTATPGSINTIGIIGGITAGQTLRGIDFRPATNTLYAVSTDGGENAQMYTINLATGAASAVGAGFSLTGLDTGNISIDFNPAVDRLRINSLNGKSYRANPITGGFVARDTDGSWDPSSGSTGVPSYSGIAYSNNVPGAPGGTTLYAYEYASDRLVTIGGPNSVPSPNGGVTFAVGSTGLFALGQNTSFDISGATGMAYAGVSDFGDPTAFYSVNLATGAHTLVGTFGTDIVDFSVVPAPSSLALIALGTIAAGRRRR